MQTDDIKKLADLSRIEMNEADLDKTATEIGAILGYIENIKKVATSDDGSRIESAGVRNVTRTDEFRGLEADIDALIKEAPASQDGYVKVKKVL